MQQPSLIYYHFSILANNFFHLWFEYLLRYYAHVVWVEVGEESCSFSSTPLSSQNPTIQPRISFPITELLQHTNKTASYTW